MPRPKALLPRLALLGAVGALLWAERRWPRRPIEAGERLGRNLTLAATALSVSGGVGGPATAWVARGNGERGRGIVGRLPDPLRGAAGFLLLDHSMYLWHVATHRVPALWRLHRVHHIDRALDASTGPRFHALDLLLSVPMDMARLRLIGAGPAAWRVWRGFFGLSVLFHHSNLALPPRWERRLSRVLTTPGMHDVHHRAVHALTDSNWTSGLSLWDRLHGTFRAPGEQPDAPIGVAGYPRDLHTADLLALPLEPTADDWPDRDTDRHWERAETTP